MSLQFPIIYLLPTHINLDELPEWESKIPTLTYDINEAQIILGKISNKERAKFELRRRKIVTDDIPSSSPSPSAPLSNSYGPPLKRRKVSTSLLPEPTQSPKQINLPDEDEEYNSDVDIDTHTLESQKGLGDLGLSSAGTDENKSIIKIVKLAWAVKYKT